MRAFLSSKNKAKPQNAPIHYNEQPQSSPPTSRQLPSAPQQNGEPQYKSHQREPMQNDYPSRIEPRPRNTYASDAGSSIRSNSVYAESTLTPEDSRSQITSVTAPSITTVDGGRAKPGRAPHNVCKVMPCQTMGTVQPHGCLIGLKYNERRRLQVMVASENCVQVMAYLPEQLFALESILDIIKGEFHDEFIAHIEYALSHPETLNQETRLDVLKLVLGFTFEPDIPLWCALHLTSTPEKMVICELEPYRTTDFLRDIGAARVVSVVATPSFMDQSWTKEEYAKSTTSASKPLQVFQIVRKRENKEFSSMDVLNALTQAEEQLSLCGNVTEILDVGVGLISELTGYHRVIISSYDENLNGQIEAELVNQNASTDIFRGLRVTYSDILKEAHKNLKTNRLVGLFDRDAVDARLLCRAESAAELHRKPLDLTRSYLKAVKPDYIKYLEHLSVKSSLKISIVVDEHVWGLIACHGYGDRGVRVSLAVRELVRLIGNAIGFNISRVHMQEKLGMRKVAVPAPGGVDAAIGDNQSDLLHVFDADFAVLNIKEKQRTIGRLESYQEAASIMLYLKKCNMTAITASESITKDFPGLVFAQGGNNIVGILFIPLSTGENGDFLIFFRRAQMQQVRWLGHPYEGAHTNSYSEADPRRDFKIWVETIKNTSRKWTENQVDIASVLRMMYARFMDVWPTKAASGGGQRLATINRAGERLRPTINDLVNGLDQVFESCNDDKTRSLLGKCNESAMSMAQLVGELVNLTATEKHLISLDGMFDPSIAATNILKELQADAHNSGRTLNITVHSEDLPTSVKGDMDRFKQVVVYFTENAFQFSSTASVEVSGDDQTIVVEIEDEGPLRTDKQIEGIRREIENAGHDDSINSGGDGISFRGIAKYVKGINGQILVAPGHEKGTVFTIEIPFAHYQGDAPKSSRKPRPTKVKGPRAPTTPKQRNRQSPPHDVLTPVNTPPQNKVAARPTTPSSVPDTTHAKSLGIVLAETNPGTLKMLAEKLAQWGHTVAEAGDGQACHQAFLDDPSKIDLVIMDVDMPVLDGISTTRMIRFTEKEHRAQLKTSGASLPPRVSIIAVSTEMSEEDKYEYMQSGFDGWLPKPLSLRRLDLMIQSAKNPAMKKDALYLPSNWAQGGWFTA